MNNFSTDIAHALFQHQDVNEIFRFQNRVPGQQPGGSGPGPTPIGRHVSTEGFTLRLEKDRSHLHKIIDGTVLISRFLVSTTSYTPLSVRLNPFVIDK